MRLYRITRKKFIEEDLEGTGAKMYGGRWNSKGTKMVYTSGSQALAILEKLVHFEKDLLPTNQIIIEYEVSEEVEIENLSKGIFNTINFRSYPTEDITKEIGDSFISRNEALLLKVPSIISKTDFNYLINPDHPDIIKVKTKETNLFEFDKRLINK